MALSSQLNAIQCILCEAVTLSLVSTSFYRLNVASLQPMCSVINLQISDY